MRIPDTDTLQGTRAVRIAAPVICVALINVMCAVTAVADAELPEPALGLGVESFATFATRPGQISFDDQDNLYVGNFNISGEDAENAHVYRVDPGGNVFSFGDVIPDPDAAVVDRNGDVGAAGSVIVAGLTLDGEGRLTEIVADGSMSNQLHEGGCLHNVQMLAFDSLGRLIVPVQDRERVCVVEDGVVSEFIPETISGLDRVVIDPADNVYLSAGVDGEILVYDLDGNQLSVELPSGSVLGWGPPGPFEGLIIKQAGGALIKFDPGSQEQITLLSNGGADYVTFSQTGDLFVCQLSAKRILRVFPQSPGPSGAVGDLRLSKLPSGDVSLSWGASCSFGDSDYSLYEGLLGDFASHAPRLCTTGGARDIAIQPPMTDSYYLVVPHDGVSEGFYGLQSDGVLREPSLGACRAQDLGCAVQPLPEGVISWWPGDGSPHDVAGENHGVLKDVEFGPGILGLAFSFPIGVDSSVDIGNPDDLDFGTSADFSLVAWIWTEESTNQGIVDQRNTTAPSQGFVVSVGGGLLKLSMGDVDGDILSVNGSQSVNDGSFHHVVISCKRDGMARIYVDGLLDGEASMSSIGNITNDGQFVIGRGNVNIPASAHKSFAGLIDEVLVFNRALEPDEVESLFAPGPPIP